MKPLPTFGASAGGPEEAMAVLVVVAVSVLGLWRLWQWFWSGPRTADPWDDRVAAGLEAEEARPVCHRCLEPHGPLVHFCPACGAPVGPYTNWLPYPYLFSLGHLLRLGASGEYKRTPVTVGGLCLLGLTEYAVFAPVYWYRVHRGLREARRIAADTDESPPPAAAPPDAPADPGQSP